MSKKYIRSALRASILVILFVFWKAIHLNEKTYDNVGLLKHNDMHDYNSTVVLKHNDVHGYNLTEARDPYLFTYSAFEDDRLSTDGHITQVRVLTFLHVNDSRPYVCYFLREKTVVLTVNAKMHLIVDKFYPNMRHNDRKYMLAAEFTCDIPRSTLHGQGEVLLTLLTGGLWDLPIIRQGAVQIQRASPPDRTPKRKFTVCLCPLYGKVSVADFVEMMEVNMYFGANFFTIYNHSIPMELNRIIEVYQKEGLLEIVQWGLKEPVLTYSHYYGQELVINDCLYRQMASSEFLVFTDLDEFIAPITHGTWQPMMEAIQDQRYASYMFLHAYHMVSSSRKRNEMKIANIEKYKNDTLPPQVRSKLIVPPQNMRYMGVHMPFTSIPGKEHFIVPSHVGQVHHFKRFYERNERFSFEPNIFWKNVLSNTINNFQKRLKQA